MFITLFVLRPAKVIGTNLDYEIMNFAINVKTLEKTKNGNKKHKKTPDVLSGVFYLLKFYYLKLKLDLDTNSPLSKTLTK